MSAKTEIIKRGWKRLKLGEVCDILSGGTPDSTKSEYWDDGDIYWATLPDLHKKYIFDTGRKITQLGLKKSSAKILPINSVIFSSRATIGEVSITKVPISTNQGSKNFICNPNYLSEEFLYYFLKSRVGEIKTLATGATYKEINKTTFSNFEILLPTIAEQKKIAEVLGAYDDLIEVNQKKIKILEDMAQVIYKEWFVKPVKNGLPDGWEVKKLGDEIEINKGKNITKNTITPGDIPVVAGGLNPAYYHNVANTIAPVITVSASGANAGYINLYNENIWASDCSYIDKDITPYVYFYYLFLLENQSEVKKLQRGSAQPHVYPVDLMRLEIVDPTDLAISKFEEKIAPFFEEIANLKKQNKNLQKTRDLLIPQLVGGNIELK